ncbi:MULTISPECIES: YciI family protein [unclassified Francisella]|uniref:YciI family protein n=1 Tax=unclassified Francisella TaxID=2610885 RepID=UPI002E34BA34|nr:MULTISPECIES: YciI family protein [unclassified Francisella]MED7818367.1 YciI family protein [Francisella sp. 19S2-4]MED7829203.1 YciI family protein [Francisella sp. 19S2-10]
MHIHIIDLQYLVEESEVAKIRPSHRDFLDIGYNKGIFLASGPKIPKTGGVILALGNIDEIKEFIKNDPFYINNIAKYSFSSFDAVKHIPEIKI